jgi:hypothetical protein
MSDLNGGSGTREIASLQVKFKNHPDLADLTRRMKTVLGAQAEPGELLEVKIIEPALTSRTPKKMARSRRVLVGVYLLVLGVTLLAVIPWAWSFASRAIAGQKVAASFLGRFPFTPTAEFSMVLIVMLSAILGSVVVLALTFSARAGCETLERGFLWWYLTRPISAAGLGLLFYMAFVAGFFSASPAQSSQALILAAAIGGLAGLFTDQVRQKMSKVLGLLPTSELASENKDTSGK